MSVLIGGASGFLGRALAKVLSLEGYNVTCLTRAKERVLPSSPYFHDVITWDEVSDLGLPDDCKAVVNLSGENIMQIPRRWTFDYQREVIFSRVDTTKELAKLIMKAKNRPEVFITASGVGYYKPSRTANYDENTQGTGNDFLGKLATIWEEASQLPKDSGVRVVNIRTGAVLGRGGGVVKNLYWPFFFGIGGHVGDGGQPFPWIHIEDIANLYKFVMEQKSCKGVYNGVAPQIITNADFTKAFAKSMNRPAILPAPVFAMKLLLGLERAVILTDGQKVHPKRVLDAKFLYKFPQIQAACDDVCNSPSEKEE